MVIPDVYIVRRIFCSQCPLCLHIHLQMSWTTQLTSLLKSVGCPAPALFHLLLNGRSKDGRSPTGSSTYVEDDIQVQLMFYSTFEVLDLPSSGQMETRRVVKLYEPSPMPILYVGPVSNVLGRFPLMPLFLRGNSTPTIQHVTCQCSTAFPIRLCRRRQGVGQEGKQRLRGEPMVVALWEGQASSGGSVSV